MPGTSIFQPDAILFAKMARELYHRNLIGEEKYRNICMVFVQIVSNTNLPQDHIESVLHNMYSNFPWPLYRMYIKNKL